MKITKKLLNEWDACSGGRKWFIGQKESNGIKLVDTLIHVNLDWANWLIVRLMDKPQRVRYAIFAAEQVIGLFEQKYPDDKRPRNAIEAAKKWLEEQNEENATHAAYAAYAAANAAHAAGFAPAHAAYAAYAAANAAHADYADYAHADYAHAAHAAYAAYAADAADAAAKAVAADSDAAKKKLKEKIIRNGIEILNGVKP